MRFTFPRPELLPIFLLIVSGGLLGWGFIADSIELITLGSLGVALTLFAFAFVPRLLGSPPSDEAPEQGSGGDDHPKDAGE